MSETLPPSERALAEARARGEMRWVALVRQAAEDIERRWPEAPPGCVPADSEVARVLSVAMECTHLVERFEELTPALLLDMARSLAAWHYGEAPRPAWLPEKSLLRVECAVPEPGIYPGVPPGGETSEGWHPGVVKAWVSKDLNWAQQMHLLRVVLGRHQLSGPEGQAGELLLQTLRSETLIAGKGRLPAYLVSHSRPRLAQIELFFSGHAYYDLRWLLEFLDACGIVSTFCADIDCRDYWGMVYRLGCRLVGLHPLDKKSLGRKYPDCGEAEKPPESRASLEGLARTMDSGRIRPLKRQEVLDFYRRQREEMLTPAAGPRAVSPPDADSGETHGEGVGGDPSCG